MGDGGKFWDSEEERLAYEAAQRGDSTLKNPQPASMRDIPAGNALTPVGPIVTGSQTTPAAPKPQAAVPHVGVDERGVLDPQTMDAQWRMACALSKTGALGPTYEGNPGAVLLAMNLAAEKGKAPFSFLASSYEIKGKITEWGSDSLGAVLASGLVKTFQVLYFSKEGKTLDELDFLTPVWGVACIGERTSPPVRAVRYFTEADAIKANLMKKDTYQQYFRRMCETKCVGAVLKIVWPDAIAGIPMPDYDDHAASDPGAPSEATAPSGAKERLSRGNQQEAQATDQGAPVPGVRASGIQLEPSGSGARAHLQGDAAGSPDEHHSSVPAVPHGAARELEPVPVEASRRSPRAGKARVANRQPSLPTI